MKIKIDKKVIYLFLFGLALIFAFISGQKYGFSVAEKKNILNKKIELENKTKILGKIKAEKEKKEKIKKLFSGLDAKAILVKKFNQPEIIFEKNQEKILPIASITKIVNAIVAMQSPEKKVYITNRALKATGYYGLSSGEVFKKEDAIKFMLIESVNDIASAISFGPAGGIVPHWQNFMQKMNDFVSKNQINSTLFFSENGLDINGHILGSYSSAKDIAKITEFFYLAYPEIAKSTQQKETKICSNLKCHQVHSTNILLEKYPEILFTKTGYTKKAGGSIVVVVEIDGKKYTIVVLDSTKDGRFKVLSRIIEILKTLSKENML